jgi:flagellar motor protein MotB
MRYNLLFVIVLLLICSSSLDAQKDVSVKRREFKAGKQGFRDAWKHVKEGDNFYVAKGLWYGNAFDEYLKAVLYNNSNPELNYKLGASALFCDRKEEAAGFLMKALEVKKDVAPDILFLTGRGLQYSGKYSEAIEKYNSYLTAKVKKSKENISKTKKYIEECNSALNIIKDTLRIEITNIGNNINSSSDDFSQLLTSDGKTMFFGSRRKMAGSSNYYSDTKFDENIFASHYNNGAWDIAKSAGKNLHTKYCEVPLYVNATNDRLYLYVGYENGGDIKMSKYKRGKWRSPEAVPYRINSSKSETSFCFTPSGKEIYFVTENGKGNLGGKDIYFIKNIKGRRWSKPKNAGPTINTVYDEESVRFSRNGDTLWFSSKGHNSIGGFDVYYSIQKANGEWDTAKNIGYPLNTPWDEIFYLPSPSDGKAFYFSSNRSGGFGGLDIYSGRVLPPLPVEVVAPPPPPPPPPVKTDTVVVRDTVIVKEPVIPPAPVVKQDTVAEVVLYLIGKVTDSESGEPIIAKIDVIDISTDLVVVTTASSDIDGSYRVRLPARKPYMIDLRATGFLSDMKRIDISAAYTKEVYTLDVPMVKVKVGKKIVLKSIMFETGKSVLTYGSYTEINELLKILEENAQMRIEISGHTDKTGSEPLNLKLSELRAKAVMDYLIKKGIDQSRLEYRGFGSVQPISDNTTPQGRAKNRRVEFKILEF